MNKDQFVERDRCVREGEISRKAQGNYCTNSNVSQAQTVVAQQQNNESSNTAQQQKK